MPLIEEAVTIISDRDFRLCADKHAFRVPSNPAPVSIVGSTDTGIMTRTASAWNGAHIFGIFPTGHTMPELVEGRDPLPRQAEQGGSKH